VVFYGGGDDGDLLSSVVSGAGAEAGEYAVLSECGGGAAGGVSGV
jgi:hypothetical protein